ncbi:MAG: class II aldolase/adducin family protein [Eubacteriales bacterium]|jgi:rhamnose utilization protein RhaD (predicted bifunctional aldolase and dehydrogenase)|nr:class II aldolase/adducin family protein [Eubacteriales bacterium]
MSLKKLVEISNFYGQNEDVVLAGGGNTSFKDKDFLYIKGSGTTLATITESGFVKMDRQKLAKMWERSYSEDTAKREAQVLADLMDARIDKDKRPSVETSLHDLFEQSYVVHTHPALVNGLTCGADGERIAKELFGEDVIWIGPTMPGYVLAATVKEKIDNLKKNGIVANMLFMANHGVFVAGNTEEEIANLMNMIFDKLSSMVKRKPDLTPVEKDAYTSVFKKVLGQEVALFECNREILNFVENEESFLKVHSAYTPDHMVYYKHKAMFLKNGEDIKSAVEKFENKYGFLPKVIGLEKTGIIVLEESEKAAKIAAKLFCDTVKIAVYAESFGGGVFMPDWLIDFIANWEVESYRKSQSSSL